MSFSTILLYFLYHFGILTAALPVSFHCRGERDHIQSFLMFPSMEIRHASLGILFAWSENQSSRRVLKRKRENQKNRPIRMGRVHYNLNSAM